MVLCGGVGIGICGGCRAYHFFGIPNKSGHLLFEESWTDGRSSYAGNSLQLSLVGARFGNCRDGRGNNHVEEIRFLIQEKLYVHYFGRYRRRISFRSSYKFLGS